MATGHRFESGRLLQALQNLFTNGKRVLLLSEVVDRWGGWLVSRKLNVEGVGNVSGANSSGLPANF